MSCRGRMGRRCRGNDKEVEAFGRNDIDVWAGGGMLRALA